MDTVIQVFDFTQVSFGRSKVGGYTGQNGFFGKFNRTVGVLGMCSFEAGK